jgi:pSer/pThr/pTyr-binding forkhead associated (FHA) protein
MCWLLDRGRQIPLKIGLNSIGRLPDNDVVIDDPTVSRRHCAIVVHSDLSVEIHDIASKNGVVVNGHKSPGATPLKDADEISLCDRRLVFVMKSGAVTVDRPASRHSRLSDDHTLAG